jgi:hypothetical protein
MATKKENADLLKARTGLSLNPEAKTPLAAVLEDWATRAETQPDEVRREVYIAQIEDALQVELSADSISTAVLAGYYERLESDAAGLLAELTGEGEAESGDSGERLSVRVSGALAGYGATITCNEQAPACRVIGTVPVRVRSSLVVDQALKRGDLILVE